MIHQLITMIDHKESVWIVLTTILTTREPERIVYESAKRRSGFDDSMGLQDDRSDIHTKRVLLLAETAIICYNRISIDALG